MKTKNVDEFIGVMRTVDQFSFDEIMPITFEECLKKITVDQIDNFGDLTEWLKEKGFTEFELGFILGFIHHKVAKNEDNGGDNKYEIQYLR
ncbi:hypothetical protein [Sulfuricurvum sp.]|uniref:hypothetical protein n=1 Tax=Sulfuricurvum sp. TaxID=2025608 RepID=UPI0035638807